MTDRWDNRRCLLSPLEKLNSFRDAVQSIQEGRLPFIYGPMETQRAHVLAALSVKTGRSLILVEPNELQAARMLEDLNAFLPESACFLPARELSFVRTDASSHELGMQRLQVLGDCLQGKVRILIVGVEALMNRMPAAAALRKRIITITDKTCVEPSDLIASLVSNGYERGSVVEAKGQCALRGGILDVFPINALNPVRIEFFDDEVDSMRSFDVLTQRSIENLDGLVIYPAREFLLTPEEAGNAARRIRAEMKKMAADHSEEARQKKIEKEFGLSPFQEFLSQMEDEDEKATYSAALGGLGGHRARGFEAMIEALNAGTGFDNAENILPVLLGSEHSILEYLPDAVIALESPESLRFAAEKRMESLGQMFATSMEQGEVLPAQAEILKTWDECLPEIRGRQALVTLPFLRKDNDFQPGALCGIEGMEVTNYQGNLKEAADDMKRWQKEGWTIVLLAGAVSRCERLQILLKEQDFETSRPEEMPDTVEGEWPLILPLTAGRGFLYPQIRYAVICESNLYGVNRQKRQAHATRGEKIAAFTDLKVGDYVVHEVHGIGQFLGVTTMVSEGITRDFLNIRYAGADKLYVPTDQLDRVQKYIGSEGEAPKLNSLSGNAWQKAKARARRQVELIAKDLLKLYADREAATGYAFEPDTTWQKEFENNFPYEETPDQLQAIAEIKEDMEKPRIMDRLLCGDVGYGKTEVALRAIFKAVMSGKQAAMLAPTTILVQQHYATMLNRFAGFPIVIEVISRLKSVTEQKKILQRLKEGTVDVIVGTHRLLGKDVQFADLGLLVVDEEQRFGVAHKETIKKMKRNVDVLTLSATPIPRTLHMSMVGIRDMSVLKSPPENRYPVQTYVVEYSDGLVRDAIVRELARGGQVYVLYNRVQSIGVMYSRLKKLIPEARIAIGHGQMDGAALENVMMDFYDGEYDVLLCTTIIESGLDVPRANTLIVCDADRFGLAQLYQLRGRVGRSNRLAYAYLTINPRKVLNEVAEKRLSAIREFTEFGSGFRVAMRDLEIRGAGNLLGSEQSGFISEVGYDLYVKMIQEAVGALSGDLDEKESARMDIHLDAYLPRDYVADDQIRIEMYKKIAGITDPESKGDLIEELIDRFGEPRRPVSNLIEIAMLKAMCERLQIDYVTQKNNEIQMRFRMGADLDIIRLLKAISMYPDTLRIGNTNPSSLIYKGGNDPTETRLKKCAALMCEVVRNYEGLGKTQLPSGRTESGETAAKPENQPPKNSKENAKEKNPSAGMTGIAALAPAENRTGITEWSWSHRRNADEKPMVPTPAAGKSGSTDALRAGSRTELPKRGPSISGSAKARKTAGAEPRAAGTDAMIAEKGVPAETVPSGRMFSRPDAPASRTNRTPVRSGYTAGRSGLRSNSFQYSPLGTHKASESAALKNAGGALPGAAGSDERPDSADPEKRSEV